MDFERCISDLSGSSIIVYNDDIPVKHHVEAQNHLFHWEWGAPAVSLKNPHELYSCPLIEKWALKSVFQTI